MSMRKKQIGRPPMPENERKRHVAQIRLSDGQLAYAREIQEQQGITLTEVLIMGLSMWAIWEAAKSNKG
jgi:hypothetical protein